MMMRHQKFKLFEGIYKLEEVSSVICVDTEPHNSLIFSQEFQQVLGW